MRCQDFEAKGGKVTVPVGCNGLEDWLLDNVEVHKLLPLLKKGPAACCCILQASADNIQLFLFFVDLAFRFRL